MGDNDYRQNQGEGRIAGRLWFAALLTIAFLAVPVSRALAQAGTIIVAGYVAHPELGTLLTDTAGITLYTWEGDTQGTGTSNCYDACAAAWPPMLVDAPIAMALMNNESPTAIGVMARTDMTYQLTYEAWPLYSFVRDSAPGDVNGDGSTGFGGRWSIVPLYLTRLGI
jgi:predicted lipoprotein with Yx(FWY)xxD motif